MLLSKHLSNFVKLLSYVVNILSNFVNILSNVVKMLSNFVNNYQQVVKCCQHFVKMLSTFCQHFDNILGEFFNCVFCCLFDDLLFLRVLEGSESSGRLVGFISTNFGPNPTSWCRVMTKLPKVKPLHPSK